MAASPTPPRPKTAQMEPGVTWTPESNQRHRKVNDSDKKGSKGAGTKAVSWERNARIKMQWIIQGLFKCKSQPHATPPHLHRVQDGTVARGDATTKQAHLRTLHAHTESWRR
jgi:hypothetical protein